MNDAWNPSSYEEELAQGLALSGESSTFFARERVRHVAARCAALKLTPRSVLELGCGTGTNLAFLGEAFPDARLVGLERSDAMLDAARARFADTPTVLAADQAFTETGTIDLLFVNGVFHHIEPKDRPAAFSLIRRLLAPQGLLALFDNNPLNPGAMWVMKRIPFDRDAQPVRGSTLARLATAAGLHAPLVRTHFYFPKPLAFLRPLEPLLAPLPLGAQYVLYARG